MNDMLEVQTFLKFHRREPSVDGCSRSPLIALSELGVKARRHEGYPNLVLLKYDQFEADMSSPLVRECRGLILDEANDWAIVSFPYRKFFNHGEHHADVLDWATARVYEKLDGSLCNLYFYDGKWHVSTSGCPDGENVVNDWGMTFKDLFWRTYMTMGYGGGGERYRGLLERERKFTFMFELMAPENRVIVQHKKPRLVLHGVRNNLTGIELSPEMFSDIFEVVRSYPLGTIDDVLAAATRLDPVASEGYVVVDGTFNRLKVKSPQYVALHHMRDGLSRRRLVELAKTNESEEFLSYFPEFRADYELIKGKISVLKRRVQRTYDLLRDIPEQKTFAICATKTDISGVLFALRSGKVGSVDEWVRDVVTTDKLADLLDVTEMTDTEFLLSK